MIWSPQRNRKLPRPEGYVPLSEVFDAFGRKQFGKLWDGSEGAAEILELTAEQLLDHWREMEAKLADPEEREEVEWERCHKRPGTIRLGPSLLIGPILRQLDPKCEFGLLEPEGGLLEELSPRQIAEMKRISERIEWADKYPDEVLEQAVASYTERYERGQRRKKIEDPLRQDFYHGRRDAYRFEKATGSTVSVPARLWLAEEFDVSFVTSEASWKEKTATGMVERSGVILLATEVLKERVILPDREKGEGPDATRKKTRRGGRRRGPWYRELKKFLQWLYDDDERRDIFENATQIELRRLATIRIKGAEISGYPRSRSAFEAAINKAKKEIRDGR